MKAMTQNTARLEADTGIADPTPDEGDSRARLEADTGIADPTPDEGDSRARLEADTGIADPTPDGGASRLTEPAEEGARNEQPDEAGPESDALPHRDPAPRPSPTASEAATRERPRRPMASVDSSRPAASSGDAGAAARPGQRGQALMLGAADELRRARKYDGALELYERALARIPDARAAAGVVHCLRRLDRAQEALDRLAELRAAFPHDAGLDNEAAWLRIKTELDPLLEGGMVHNAALVAEEIIGGASEPAVARCAAFRTIRAAKQAREWNVVNLCCELLDPATLNARPRGNKKGAWSDLARWMAARTVALLRTGDPAAALELARRAAGQFPDQQRMFVRWQAQCHAQLGRPEQAATLYASLCQARSADWWLLHEHGKILLELGQVEQAIVQLCRAALACRRIEMSVRLLQSLASCALELDRRELAACCADLAIQIRQREQWQVPSRLCELLAAAGPIRARPERERARQCRELWREVVGGARSGDTGGDERASNRGDGDGTTDGAQQGPRVGKLMIADPERPFCFIRSRREQIFCLRADLPAGAQDGHPVRFKVVRSYDRKKERESWRAVEVELCDSEPRAEAPPPADRPAAGEEVAP